MIAVIADDFSGAAELGGIGLRYGLKVAVCTQVYEDTGAQLLIIDAGTRSVNEQEAVIKIEKVTRDLLKLQPEWIYKKTDSVLRGHVVAELDAQMKASGKQSALFVPANPDLGRIIRKGVYYFNNEPLHQSSFSIDPEFAISTSDVQEILGAQVQVAAIDAPLSGSGIVVGEAWEMKHLDRWAAQWHEDVLPAGAAGFFTAMLQQKMQAETVSMPPYEQSAPVLYVSGTTFKKSSDAIKKIKAGGGPVSYLGNGKLSELLHFNGKAILAIDPGTQNGNAAALREATASAVEEAIRINGVQELMIEGGSTARAIFDRLGLTKFFPLQELSPGVVRMKVNDGHEIFITVKPGSYAWPEGVWTF